MMMINNIPQKLKDLNQWVCFKLIYNEKLGKYDKIPYNAKTGGKAMSNNKSTWADFNTALAATTKYSFDGLGIMFANGLCGIDIDGCVDEQGNLSPLAQGIISIMNSYSELSPSGKGLHILFFGEIEDLPDTYKKNPNNGVEIYSSGRFFTVTGNCINNKDIEERKAEIKIVQEKFMSRAAQVIISPPSPSSPDDKELIIKAKNAKNGAKFTALWNGNINGYPSNSEADLALCSILAFWTSGNPDAIDRLFRQSSLFRCDKWDRKQSGTTYGWITNNKALESYNTRAINDFEPISNPVVWEKPIPFHEITLPSFPTDALPEIVRNYVLAVSETTQTSPDMAATASLPVLALAVQGKYRILGKADWIEPLNIYANFVASPAERKSAVMHFMTEGIVKYECTENEKADSLIIESQMKHSILEKEKRMLEDAAAKGKIPFNDVALKAKEISEFVELKPLKLFVDDITSEKLSSVLADNNGRMGIISAEGGIFDILSGMYSKTVNIDVFLKAHSGDTLRVDRVGRGSENIKQPTLTVLLAVQPSVLNGLMSNNVFRGRGLTARFLYSIPVSMVGTRKFETTPIPKETAERFHSLIRKLLDTKPAEAQLLTLSTDAYNVLSDFANALEPRLADDLSDIADWCGKLSGAILRIAGILHIVKNRTDPAGQEVDAETLKAAIKIGEYFLEHAKAAYLLMGADPIVKDCEYILKQLKKSQAVELPRRDIMRLCRKFKTVDEMLPALNRLVEYSYMQEKQPLPQMGAGRPTDISYLINPMIYENKEAKEMEISPLCHISHTETEFDFLL